MAADRRERETPRRRRQKRRRHGPRWLLMGLCAVLIAAAVLFMLQDDLSQARFEIQSFAAKNDLTLADYPESMVALYERNHEARDFALHYPLEYGRDHQVDMSPYQNAEGVPLFMQWDRQWGYLDYGNDVVGVAGCGPVCLAMAGYAVTGDETVFRPDNVVEFALKKGYCVPGSGSSWTLIGEGGRQLGLDVVQIPLDQNRIIKNLEVGNPIICVMGPGTFTTTGHFIVLAGMEDGKFRINDPNSRARSERLWEYDEFQDQIRNLWVIRA